MATIKGIIPITEEINFIDSISGGISTVLRGFGSRLNVSTAVNGDDIWTGVATTLPIPPDAGEQMSLVSTSIQDDNTPGGTGIRTIDIHYIDASGNPQIETIALNGTTQVNTVATNIRFVQEIHPRTAGSNLLAVGTITIFSTATPANIYNQIQPGTNQSLNTARMVPAGKTLIITGYYASAGNATKVESVELRLRATSHGGQFLSRLFHFIDNFLSFNSTTDRNYTQPIVVPSLAIVKVTSYASVAGSNVQATWEGILVPSPT